jgi:hypothetical protein
MSKSPYQEQNGCSPLTSFTLQTLLALDFLFLKMKLKLKEMRFNDILENQQNSWQVLNSIMTE